VILKLPAAAGQPAATVSKRVKIPKLRKKH
jgi:hypothetical protein